MWGLYPMRSRAKMYWPKPLNWGMATISDQVVSVVTFGRTGSGAGVAIDGAVSICVSPRFASACTTGSFASRDMQAISVATHTEATIISKNVFFITGIYGSCAPG